MEPTIVLEAYKVGGLALVLMLIIGWLIYLGWKDAKADKKRLLAEIAKCHDSHGAMLETTTGLIVNNNHAMNRIADSTDGLTAAIRDRPCLKDPTPPNGSAAQFRTPRPPIDHRQ